jgi:ABC-type multidrug transport system fused ATPase/permease subunit
MGFLSLLIKYKDVVLLLIVVAIVGFQSVRIKMLKADNKELEATVAQMKVNLETSNTSIKTLQRSVDEQNQSIDRMKKENETRIKAHQTELANAQKTAQNYKNRADEILRSKPTSSDKCISANDLINEEIIRNGKK